MGIRISESPAVFQIPYGPPNHDGTPDASFVDLKVHPDWVPVIPACIGWPETRELLEAVNSPESPLMTVAAHQCFSSPDQPAFQSVLTSLVTLCYANFEQNRKQDIDDLAGRLRDRMSDLLQVASNSLERALFLNVLLELQPTIFRLDDTEGWSLTVFMAAYGRDVEHSRTTWRIAMKALQKALAQL